MKALIVADLFIIIAFLALSQPKASVADVLTMDQFYAHTLADPESNNSIPITKKGLTRYFDDNSSRKIQMGFYNFCATKKEKCTLVLAIENDVLAWQEGE